MSKLAGDDDLRKYVVDCLSKRWIPQQVCQAPEGTAYTADLSSRIAHFSAPIVTRVRAVLFGGAAARHRQTLKPVGLPRLKARTDRAQPPVCTPRCAPSLSRTTVQCPAQGPHQLSTRIPQDGSIGCSAGTMSVAVLQSAPLSATADVGEGSRALLPPETARRVTK